MLRALGEAEASSPLNAVSSFQGKWRVKGSRRIANNMIFGTCYKEPRDAHEKGIAKPIAFNNNKGVLYMRSEYGLPKAKHPQSPTRCQTVE